MTQPKHTEPDLIPFDGCSDGQERPKFVCIPAGEFSSTWDQEEWLIDDILPRTGLGSIIGASGSGKTFCALAIAMATALGTHFLGKLVQKGRVVYVCSESPGGFRKRLAAYAFHHKISLADLTNFDIIADCPNFLNDSDVKSIITQISKGPPPSLIIVDTFSPTMAGGNENSSETVSKALQQCFTLGRETGAFVKLVHHLGKDHDKGARGWSGIKAALDTEIEVTEVRENERKIRISKQRDAETGEEWGFTLESVPLGSSPISGKKLSSCVFVQTSGIPIQDFKSSKLKRPDNLGPNQAIVLMALKNFGPGTHNIEDFIKASVTFVERGNSKEDRRREKLVRAMKSLADDGAIWMNDTHIAKTHAKNESEES